MAKNYTIRVTRDTLSDALQALDIAVDDASLQSSKNAYARAHRQLVSEMARLDRIDDERNQVKARVKNKAKVPAKRADK